MTIARRLKEPLWPIFMAILSVGGLYLAVKPTLTLGPIWLPLAVIAALSLLWLAVNALGSSKLVHAIGFVMSATLTVFLLLSLSFLIAGLPEKRETGADLLRSASALWATNIIVFAIWYWRLDGGGPAVRTSQNYKSIGGFLFPQVAMRPELRASTHSEEWVPHFIDYLFLSFTTNTAFSPTDTGALARWAKAVMMIQSVIAFTIIVILAGRVVNIF